MKATKVWFEGERIYIETDDGRTLWQSILYYQRLLHATEEQKKDFELGISNVIETWVIKEAYSKYKGKGLLIKFSDISVEDIRSECYLYDLSNKNYYCYVAGEEKIENIKTIDYKLFKKYLKNEVKI